MAAFDIPIYELEGYEADDVIGTIARQASAEGLEVLIMTGDRDQFQLVTDQVKVLYPSSGAGDLTVFGPEEVKAKMGVMPAQIPDLKGLEGGVILMVPVIGLPYLRRGLGFLIGSLGCRRD